MKTPNAASVADTRSTPDAASARSRQRKRGAWRKFVPYAVGAALLAAIIAGLRPAPVTVETAVITTGPLTVSVLEEGKTRIRRRYVVSPPVGGFLNRVALRAGDRIEAGKTVLATIQPQPASFLDPRAQAEAAARLKSMEAAKMQRETQIERARTALELSRKEQARAQALQKSGAIAAREWDTADAQVSLLTRELHGAEFALQVAEFERAQAEAALQQARNPAAENAAPLEIVSPVTGAVLNVYEENARILSAGAPIMEVGDPTDLEAEIELLSSDAVGVRPGAEVSIEQWGGERPLRGKVLLVEPGGFTKISALGVEEQRVKVRVEFVELPTAGAALGDRYRVEARIMTWQGNRVLQAPTGALFRRGGDWMTFVVDDGDKARLTKVEIAHNNGSAAEVRAGLKQGQAVILHPPDTIIDGAQVNRRAGEAE